MSAPEGAQYHFVKTEGMEWGDDLEEWFPEFHVGEDIYLKVEGRRLLVYSKRKWEPTGYLLKDFATLLWHEWDGPELTEVIPTGKMAEATVRIAAILREMGIDECRYNESLNCLQYVLSRNYLDEWASKKAADQSGNYEYWQDAHRRAGITRPSD